MMCAKCLFRAEKMATPTLKFEAQKSVRPSRVQAVWISSLWASVHPVVPLTTFTPALHAFWQLEKAVCGVVNSMATSAEANSAERKAS